MEAVNNRLEGRRSGTLGGNISMFQVKVSHKSLVSFFSYACEMIKISFEFLP